MANKTKKLKRRHQATTGTLLGTRTPSPPHRTTKTMPLLQWAAAAPPPLEKREMEGNARDRETKRNAERENQGSEVGKERRRTAGSGSSATAARSPELKP
jgi:hypothetical protein